MFLAHFTMSAEIFNRLEEAWPIKLLLEDVKSFGYAHVSNLLMGLFQDGWRDEFWEDDLLPFLCRIVHPLSAQEIIID